MTSRNSDNIFVMYSISYILFLCVPPLINTVSVKIDGIIDLGPNWNYKYTLKSYKENDHQVKFNTELKQRFRNDEIPKIKLVHYDNSISKLIRYDSPDIKLVDIYDQPNNIERHLKNDVMRVKPIVKETDVTKAIARMTESTDLYTNSHKIKNDKANEFLKHIYKQSMTVFDSLKAKVNDYHLRKKIDRLSKNYQMKFRTFIKETQGHTIKSRLGTQKVIMNAIQVSSVLMNRLVSVTLGDLTKKGLLRNKDAVNIIQKEVNKAIDVEYKHACSKFKICRTDATFSKFVANALAILLKNDDKKLKMAVDALTETLKNNQFSSIMSDDMAKKFHQGVEVMEQVHISNIKPFLMIIRNILASKYRPLVIMEKLDTRVNRTLALLEIVDVFDKSLPGNEINTLEWNDITNSLSEWSNGKRSDIVDIMQTLVDYFIKSTDRMDSKSLEAIQNKLKYFFD